MQIAHYAQSESHYENQPWKITSPDVFVKSWCSTFDFLRKSNNCLYELGSESSDAGVQNAL